MKVLCRECGNEVGASAWENGKCVGCQSALAVEMVAEAITRENVVCLRRIVQDAIINLDGYAETRFYTPTRLRNIANDLRVGFEILRGVV